MTHFKDVVDVDVYAKAVEAGYIKRQTHPDVPYTIHNYTDACTWDQAWDEATLNCRGLITDNLTGEVVARGMPKFFNSDQEQAPKFSLEDEVITSDKMDGSLGILYKMPNGGGWRIATRGSFVSEQAIWATEWLNNMEPTGRYLFAIENRTYLYEIIYPDNRIVVDYEGKEGLVLLGWVDNVTGRFTPASIEGHDCAQRFEYKTWGEVLAAPERPNSEGFVVTRKSDGAMVKIKYEDYKRLHKYMTRVTERHVWECLAADRNVNTEFAGAPDEFHQWVREVAHRLESNFELRHIRLIKAYRKIMFGPLEETFTYPHVDERTAKKNFAMAIKDEPDKAYYFAMYDERTIVPMLWKEFKPEARTFKVVSSDAD